MQTCIKTAPREACKRPECSQESQTNLFCAAGPNWRSKILFGIFPDANTTRLTNVIVVDRWFVLKRRARLCDWRYISAACIRQRLLVSVSISPVCSEEMEEIEYAEAGGKPHRSICR